MKAKRPGSVEERREGKRENDTGVREVSRQTKRGEAVRSMRICP